MLCPRCVKVILVIFRRFLNFGPFFGPFLGTLVENSKHKKVAPGNSLNFPKKIKIVTLIFGSQNCVFLKCTFSGPQLSWRGLVWYLLNSWKARAPRGLDKLLKTIFLFITSCHYHSSQHVDKRFYVNFQYH